ncbi:hypothetical protein [Sphingobacterium prati]|uniref:hypothetical protein n=1 Tax=Sphingobacterium prati TaxID=2737006 RepID=UPI001C132050|nr:hypothetical protein [Sphingobacterium prati]
MFYDYDEKRYRDEEGNTVNFDKVLPYHQHGGCKGDPPPKTSLEVYIIIRIYLYRDIKMKCEKFSQDIIDVKDGMQPLEY